MLDQNALEVSSPAAATDRIEDESSPAEAARTATPRGTVAAVETLEEGDDVESLYVRHRTLLFFVACRKFRVPESDAESLIQEVFLSFLQTRTTIENKRSWLVAAMCNASRHYWRTQGRTESLPDDYGEQSDPRSQSIADKIAQQMTMQKVLGYLQPRCRETLRLHYFEGRSAADVATQLDTTSRYAEKLIHNCLKRVREIYTTITAVQR
ncbi:MAG: sigma-70 family RNA polymerase sigma factor [Acidobacteriota bacterium]